MTLRSPAEKLGQILNRRRSDDAELRPTRVQGRLGDGRTQYLRLDSECVETGPVCATNTGQIVERPCRPGFYLEGGSGLSMVTGTRSIGTLDVTRQEPDSFRAGWIGTVAIIGVGMLPTFALDYLHYDSREVHEGIEITAKRYVSSTEVELDLVVGPDVDVMLDEAGDPIPFPVAFDNVGSSL